MPRILLLLPSTTYRTEAFLAAARRLEVDVTVGAEYANTLTKFNPTALLKLSLFDSKQAALEVVEFASQHPIDAVVGVDDQVTDAAAAIAEQLNLRHNSVESVRAAKNKHTTRQLLEKAGVPSPRFHLWEMSSGFEQATPGFEQATKSLEFPVVVKPLSLSASQGVIRANDAAEFEQAAKRIEAILTSESSQPVSRCCGNEEETAATVGEKNSKCEPSIATENVDPCQADDLKDGQPTHQLLIEEFISGPEVALEGILIRGKLSMLALFDKPDQSDGPFFEETIYLTPSQQSAELQDAIVQTAQQATLALGLSEGPIHAELRLSSQGPVVIEINPRSIGGNCSQTLKFGSGLSLEELIISQSLEGDFVPPDRQQTPAGVMMIPIREAGELQQIKGCEAAAEVENIEQVKISAHQGMQLTPLPDGSAYLGFIFARAESVSAVESALRKAYACLEFVVSPS